MGEKKKKMEKEYLTVKYVIFRDNCTSFIEKSMK